LITFRIPNRVEAQLTAQTIAAMPILDSITALCCSLENKIEFAVKILCEFSHMSDSREFNCTIEMVSPPGISLLTGYVKHWDRMRYEMGIN